MADVTLAVRVASHLTARVLRLANPGGLHGLYVEVHPLDIRADGEARAGGYVELHPPRTQPDTVPDAETAVVLHDERFADPLYLRHAESFPGPDARSMPPPPDSEQPEVRHA